MPANKQDVLSIYFKRTARGWIYRAPGLLLFGEARHFLLNDDQKALVTALLGPRRPIVFGLLFGLAMVGWIVAVGAIAWSIGFDPDKADFAQTAAIFAAFFSPVFVVPSLVIWMQRRRLRPVLANAPRSAETIPLDEIRDAKAAIITPRVAIGLAALWTFIGATQVSTLALGAHRHPLFSDARSYFQVVMVTAAASLAVYYTIVAIRQLTKKAEQQA